MGRRTKEKEDADINIKSSNVPLHYCSDHIMWQKTREREKADMSIGYSHSVLSNNYKDAIRDELSELEDKIAAIEGDRQPSSKRRRIISVKVYV